MEDIIKCKEGSPLLLYCCIDDDIVNKRCQGKPHIVASTQKKLGLVIDIITIDGNQYVCIKEKNHMAALHRDI